MLISCPYCGPRDVAEFTYQGDGNRVRPNPTSQDLDAWNEYIFDRVNIAGEHNEIWQHSGGCRSHIFVVRNTLTHKISSVRMVRDEPAPPVVKRAVVDTVQTALAEQALKSAKAGLQSKPVLKAPVKSAAKAAPAKKPRGTK